MKIRVLHVEESVSGGGVERTRQAFAKLLPKYDFEQKLICTKTQGPLADEIRAEGVEVIPVGLLSKVWEISRYRAVLKIIKEYKPHIIHGAVFEGVLLASISGFIGRVPIIVLEETSDPQNRSRKASFLFKLLTKLSDRVIGVSPSVCSYLKDVAKVEPNKIEFINYGVVPPDDIPLSSTLELKRKLGIKDTDVVVGSVGRLRNFHKRFTDLVEALALLKNDFPNLKLLIVGEGGDRKMIEEHAVTFGVSDRLIMAGFQINPHPFFKMMDIFAIASHMEAFGLVSVEAMFHKLPVIATRVGGLKDIVLHNETGILVDAHQPKQIAAAISKLVLDKQLRVRMGKSGYSRAQNEFSAQRYVNDVEKLYRELIAKKGITELADHREPA